MTDTIITICGVVGFAFWLGYCIHAQWWRVEGWREHRYIERLIREQRRQ